MAAFTCTLYSIHDWRKNRFSVRCYLWSVCTKADLKAAMKSILIFIETQHHLSEEGIKIVVTPK